MALHSHKTDPRSLISDNTSMFRWFVVARSHFRKIRSVIVNVWGADFLPRFCGCLQLTLEWQSGTVSFLFFRQTQRYNAPDKRLIQLIFRRLSSEVVLWRGKLHRQEKRSVAIKHEHGDRKRACEDLPTNRLGRCWRYECRFWMKDTTSR